MRMWMIDPRQMCNRHLLGEHVECHMLVGSLVKGRSIGGFLAGGLLDPSSVRTRHAELAIEMRNRGMNHHSPLPRHKRGPRGIVDAKRSRRELARRCRDCRARISRKMR